jgi:hypothetical protein
VAMQDIDFGSEPGESLNFFFLKRTKKKRSIVGDRQYDFLPPTVELF